MTSRVYPYASLPNHQDVLPRFSNSGNAYAPGCSDYYTVEERPARYKSPPIHDCPTEILLQIMRHAIPEPPTVASILRFGAVCRQWRMVAWSSTELWSRICFNFQYSEYQPALTPRDSDADVPMMQEWIKRAGPTRSLSLRIKCSVFTLQSRFYKCPFVEPTQLLNLFCCAVDRWESLDLSIPLSWFMYFRNLVFLELKSVRLRTFDTDPRVVRPGFPLSQFVLNWTAPFLQSVELHGVEVSVQGLPWAQLSHITLYDTKPEGFLEVLPLCRNAIEIKVTILWGTYQRMRSNPLPRPTQADLPLLEHLLMFAEDPGFQVHILSGLLAPRVQRITTNLFWDRLEGLPAAIKSFVKRCRLRKLALGVNLDESKVTAKSADDLCAKLTRQAMVPIYFKGGSSAIQTVCSISLTSSYEQNLP